MYKGNILLISAKTKIVNFPLKKYETQHYNISILLCIYAHDCIFLL